MNFQVEIIKKRLHMRGLFVQANQQLDSAESLFIKLTDENGVTAYGSTTPEIKVTQEDAESIYKILVNDLTPDFFDKPVSEWNYYHEKIQKRFAGYPSACHIIEEAVLNLFCKQKEISLRDFFGTYREKAPIMYTIGMKRIDETIQIAKEKISEGHTIIKMKVGLQVDEDIEKIIKVNEILPTNIQLELDGNQGYSFSDAKKLVTSLQDCQIAYIEQPFLREDIDSMEKLHRESRIPIFADESAITVEESINLLKNDQCAGVNIKLMKCGGPINFIKIFKFAKSVNKKVMIGCMFESHMSLTTGAALACAFPVDYVDLDSGHIDFIDDPTKDGAVIKNGYIYPGTKQPTL